MQCKCGGEMKPYWNLVKNKVPYVQISECKGCGRVHKRKLKNDR